MGACYSIGCKDRMKFKEVLDMRYVMRIDRSSIRWVEATPKMALNLWKELGLKPSVCYYCDMSLDPTKTSKFYFDKIMNMETLFGGVIADVEYGISTNDVTFRVYVFVPEDKFDGFIEGISDPGFNKALMWYSIRCDDGTVFSSGKEAHYEYDYLPLIVTCAFCNRDFDSALLVNRYISECGKHENMENVNVCPFCGKPNCCEIEYEEFSEDMLEECDLLSDRYDVYYNGCNVNYADYDDVCCEDIDSDDD